MTDEDLLAIIRSYTAQMEDYGDVDETRLKVEEAVEEVAEWLNEIRAEAWDSAWREIRMIPHWWNTEDQYGGFDMQPLGPDETSEQGAFMAVRKIMLENPYRSNEK